MELRAQVQGLAVALDCLSELTHLRIGVRHRGLQVCELASGRGVEGATVAARQRGGPLRVLARAIELAPLFMHGSQRQERLGIGRIQPQGVAQAFRCSRVVTLAIAQDTHHVVDVREIAA